MAIYYLRSLHNLRFCIKEVDHVFSSILERGPHGLAVSIETIMRALISLYVI